MSADAAMLAAAEARARENTGIIWDGHMGCRCAFPPKGVSSGEVHIEASVQHDSAELEHRPMRGLRESFGNCSQYIESGEGERAPGRVFARTDGAAYVYDGNLEGLLSAVFRALGARDASADIVAQGELQPRLGQETVHVETQMDEALIIRRCLEQAAGRNAFRCVRAASLSDERDTGTLVYRFVRHVMATASMGCNSCARKRTCIRACAPPATSRVFDDLGCKPVYDLMMRYRSVVNERHLMEQFVRFEHCAGDVWFARCNPKSSVVPLLMDWFVPRFNDQCFIIYDENHKVSGVYDGRRWFLVAGEEARPPAYADEEEDMKRAWRMFYRSTSIDERYHPELRRGFMPMRLWQNLPEVAFDVG